MESNQKSTIDAFISTSFDYIVIGGGTAGLPVGNRLSADPNIKVGILEAGALVENDPLVDVPCNLSLNNGNPKYDWMSSTVIQTGAAGRPIPVVRGKLLGGTSALNYLGWHRGSKAEYDAWKQVGDSGGGWDWDSLLPFFKKSEDTAPAPENRDLAVDLSASEAHIFNPGEIATSMGVGGPVKVKYNTCKTDVMSPYVKAWNALEQYTNLSPYGGNASGLYSCRVSVDPQTGKRITATTAYYTPVASRHNLKALLGAQVVKIIFKPNLVDGKQVASAVEFSVDGKIYLAFATKEIILCAGVFGTPQILEHSGIGDPKLLKALGIHPLIDLPGVGENLQDHPFIHIHYQAKSGTLTYDELSKNPEFAAAEKERYEKTGQGMMAAGNDTLVVFTPLDKIMAQSALTAKIKEMDERIVQGESKGSLNELAARQHSVQRDWLKQGILPHLESILFARGMVKPDAEGSYFMLSVGLQHPFSRGSVHVQSTDPFKRPLIDPRYLTHDFDIFSLLAGYRAIEKLAQTPPLADIVAKQLMPAAPLSDAAVIQYIRQFCVSGGHYLGTAAMARRELGGVVDNTLRVHGTANLRVADASIIPMSVAAHIQATVYAIGEKAAHIILSE